jgi:hypothetical protein
LACCAELAPHAMRVARVRDMRAVATGRSGLSPIRVHADISPFSSCRMASQAGERA